MSSKRKFKPAFTQNRLIGLPLSTTLGYKPNSTDIKVFKSQRSILFRNHDSSSLYHSFEQYFADTTRLLQEWNQKRLPSYFFQHADGHRIEFTPIMILHNLLSAKSSVIEKQIQQHFLQYRFPDNPQAQQIIQEALDAHEFAWFYKTQHLPNHIPVRQCLVFLPTSRYRQLESIQVKHPGFILAEMISSIHRSLSMRSYQTPEEMCNHLFQNNLIHQICSFATPWISISSLLLSVETLLRLIARILQIDVKGIHSALRTSLLEISHLQIGVHGQVQINRFSSTVERKHPHLLRDGRPYKHVTETSQTPIGDTTPPLLLIGIVAICICFYFSKRGNYAFDTNHPDVESLSSGLNWLLAITPVIAMSTRVYLERTLGKDQEEPFTPIASFMV